jgi:hypothetical protein
MVTVRRVVLAALILPFFASILPAQNSSILLEEVMERTDTRLQWDPYRQQGTLFRGDRVLGFALDAPFAVVDLETIHRVSPPVRSGDGSIAFDQSFLALALSVFPRRPSSGESRQFSSIRATADAIPVRSDAM